MARPRKQGLDYFPHDTDAVNSKELEAMRTFYGNDGYAFYFIMLEHIYREKNAELQVPDSETKQELYQILAKKISVTVQEFENMLETAFRWGLFDREKFESEGVITSDSIKDRAGVVFKKREEMRQKPQSDGNNKGSSSSKVSEAKTPSKTRHIEHKGKERKVKESNTLPSASENSTAYNLSIKLKNWIKYNNPKHREITDDKLKSWAIEFDRMMKLDDYTEDDINKMIDYSQTNSFWRSRILSPSKLREHADTLMAQMLDSNNKDTQKLNPVTGGRKGWETA